MVNSWRAWLVSDIKRGLIPEYMKSKIQAREKTKDLLEGITRHIGGQCLKFASEDSLFRLTCIYSLDLLIKSQLPENMDRETEGEVRSLSVETMFHWLQWLTNRSSAEYFMKSLILVFEKFLSIGLIPWNISKVLLDKIQPGIKDNMNRNWKKFDTKYYGRECIKEYHMKKLAIFWWKMRVWLSLEKNNLELQV
ncbi:MAG: hypothetical protein Ta2E_10160 [Mycoplasmoidaceae bacterium]|nr:MAG: hypothetical protein Ta2E_10160 [Mycoplasmoidaceae bacterium]